MAEVRHPRVKQFVSLFPATMLVAIGFVPRKFYRPLQDCAVSVGVVIQLAYAARRTAGLWRRRIERQRDFISAHGSE